MLSRGLGKCVICGNFGAVVAAFFIELLDGGANRLPLNPRRTGRCSRCLRKGLIERNDLV